MEQFKDPTRRKNFVIQFLVKKKKTTLTSEPFPTKTKY